MLSVLSYNGHYGKEKRQEPTYHSLLPAFPNAVVIHKDEVHLQDYDNRICQ